MKWLLVAVAAAIPAAEASAQRDTINLPNIPGYVTLKGDFLSTPSFRMGRCGRRSAHTKRIATGWTSSR